MKPNSARVRLTLVAVGLASVCLLGGGVAVDRVAARELIAQVDAGLIAEARLLASTVEQEGDQLDLEFGDLDMRDFDRTNPRAFLQLWRGEARVYRSPSLGQATLSPFSGPLAAPVTQWAVPQAAGPRLRAVGIRFTPRIDLEDGPAGPAVPVVLVLARDVSTTTHTLETLRQTLLGIGSLTLVVLTIVLWLGIRRAFRPVEVAAQEIAQIGGEELSRRLSSEGLPRELLPVVERTNELLGRVEAVVQRERAFSQEVAHELRTPLSGLRTILEVALRRDRDPAHYQSVLQDGLVVVGQQERMVENLLRLARLEAGEALASTRVDVNEVLLDAWASFGAPVTERKLSITWALADEAIAHIDQGLLQVVARNLIENAVSYADEGGAIEIGTLFQEARPHRPARLCVLVKNTGSQLTQAEAEAATQRFWRGDAARTVGQHSGLGLALVERSLQALGGRLSLRSAVGGWFQAEVVLPAADPD